MSNTTTTLSADRIADAVSAYTHEVPVTADNRAAVVAWARLNGIEGRVSTDLGIVAENSGATVKMPHSGQIVYLSDGAAIGVSLHGRACTIEAFAEAAGATAAEVDGVTDGTGREIELSHRKVQVSDSTVIVEMTSGDKFALKNSGRGRLSVAEVATRAGVEVWEIATVNGYRVKISASLETPRDK